MDKFNRVETALKTLLVKLSPLNLEEIGVSEYNQRYMSEYIKDYSFYAPLYQQLLNSAIKELKLPIEESVFVDYGGGCGILSLLAKEVGFKQVIYSDIYDISLSDAKLIAEKTNIKIDDFILGNIDELVVGITQRKISPDLICSFAVLEHIYNLDEWFKSLSKLKNSFCLVFLTSANPYNPFIRRRLMKLQRIVEFQGSEEFWGMKKRDLRIPFLNARKDIIKEIITDLDESTLEYLAKETRGLDQKDIIKEIEHYQSNGILRYKIKHPTNTCDPYTGNWAENLIDIPSVKKLLESLNFQSEVISGLYSYSSNKKLNFIKSILNQLIRINNRFGLYLSATYILKVKN